LLYVYKDEPVAERNDYAISQTAIEVDLTIEDIDEVILEGTLLAQLFIGETLIEEKAVALGETVVSFSGLLTNKTYDVKVKADFDLDDLNNVRHDVVLYSDQYTTLSKSTPNAQISNIDVSSNNVMFDVTFEDSDAVLLTDGLSVALYKDDACVLDAFDECLVIPLTGDDTGLTFTELLNDTDYVIKVLADYDLEDGNDPKIDDALATGYFTTLPRIIPLPEIRNLNVEENRVFFDVEIDDSLGLLVEESLMANIYIEGELIETTDVINNTVDFQIVNLFADHEFTIEITGSYDLNDGEGLQENEIIFTKTYTTLINEVPDVQVDEIIVEQGYVSLNLLISDPNETLKGDVVAKLYENDTVVATKYLTVQDTSVVFEYLVRYTEVYNIEFTADYNLRDGVGTFFEEILFSSIIVTVEQKAPAAEINDIITNNDELTFTVNVMDADETIEAGSVVVYLHQNGAEVDQIVVPIGETVVTFTDLMSNNDYNIVVEADYNLNDGTGIQFQQELNDVLTTTLEKALPSATLINFESSSSSITVDIIVDDVDDVILVGTIRALLYKDGLPTGDEVILTQGANPDVTFTNLLSSNAYQIHVVANYDVNDGNAQVDDYELAQGSMATLVNQNPSATIEIISESKDEVVVDITLNDIDSVITDDQVFAVIKVNDIVQGAPIQLYPGLNSNVTFSGIYSNTRFVVEVIADYDLNDGINDFDDVTLSLLSVQTLTNIAPTAEISEVVLGKTTITFDVLVTDDDATITDNLQAVLYKDGVATGQTFGLLTGTNLDVEFTGLQADSTYVVRVETDYSMKTQDPDLLAQVLDSYQAVTESLDLPSAVISITDTFNTKLVFDVTVTDVDSTITLNLKAVLYDGDAIVDELGLLSGDNIGEEFAGLEFGKEYTIKIETDYNLNDGQADITGYEMTESITSTASIISIDNFNEEKRDTTINILYDPSEVFVLFDVVIDDAYSILTGTPLSLTLYDSDDLPVGDTLFLYSDSNLEIINLLFDNTYYYIIEAEYNVGNGVVTTEVYRDEFTTQSITVEDINITNLVVTGTEITFDVNSVADPDGVITTAFEAVLIRDGVETLSQALVLGDNAVTFAQDGTDGAVYTIIVRSTVDFRDGNLAQTEYQFDAKTFVYSN